MAMSHSDGSTQPHSLDFDKEEATENSKRFHFSNGRDSHVSEAEAVRQIRWAWHLSPAPLHRLVRDMGNIPLQPVEKE